MHGNDSSKREKEMDGYKKIIRNQDTRMKILKMLSFVPDRMMIKLQYRIKLHRKLNLKKPERYTEKIQWYKLHYRNPIMTQCVDKYAVRDYIKDRGLSDCLTRLYGAYDSADEIDFDKFPEKFIIKTTNGSGTNIICRDRKKFDREKAKQELESYMNRPQISAGREWAYYNVQPKIVVEELLIDPKAPDGDINDYKFICFSGKVYCIVVDIDRHVNHRRNFYSTKWERINACSDHENFSPDVPKPENFDEMIRVAEKLSSPFPHVRVDLYNIAGKIYFGELTFYPWSGYVQYTPDSFDYDLGNSFVLQESK